MSGCVRRSERLSSPSSRTPSAASLPARVDWWKRMAEASQQHMAMWTREQIVRHVLSNVAVAIQRQNAATVLAGHAAIDFSRRGGKVGEDSEGATDDDEDDEDEDEDEAGDQEEEEEGQDEEEHKEERDEGAEEEEEEKQDEE